MLDAKLVRFLIVGVGNTLIGLLIIYLAKLCGVGDIAANAVGYGVGIAVSFYLNKQWTFAYTRRALPAFFRFLLVTCLAYVANLAAVLFAIKGLAINAYVAQALGIPIYTFLNYVGSRYFVFRQANERTEAAAYGDAMVTQKKHTQREAWIATSRIGRVASILGSVLLLCPISFYIWTSLSGLHTALRYAAVILCVAVLVLGAVLLRIYVARLRRLSAVGCLVLISIGVLLIGGRADVFPGPSNVRLIDPGSSAAQDLSPTLTNVWGKSLWVYSITPEKNGRKEMVVRFPYPPSKLKLFLTGDPGSWKNASMQGAHTLAVRVAANGPGFSSTDHTVMVPIHELGSGVWTVKSIPLPERGASELRFTVRLLGQSGDMSGPPVVLTIQPRGILAWLSAAGKTLLAGVAFGLLGLSFAGTNREGPLSSQQFGSTRARNGAIWRNALAATLFVLFLGAFVYWTSLHTRFVFFWDYRNYWSLTEQLFDKMAAGQWAQALNMFISGYPADYSMLPAVLPALLSLAVGYPSKTVYAVLITVLYAAPAFLVMAYCARRLTTPASSYAVPSACARMVPSAFAVLIGFPAFLSVVLLMMPDIGGVVLVGAALLLAHDFTVRLTAPERDEHPWHLPDGFVRICLALGTLLAVMFLFRRWYIFAAAGIAGAVLLSSFYMIFTVRRPLVAARRTLAGGVLVAMTAMLPLMPVLFDWASSISQHDYGALYSSYRRQPRGDLAFFLATFGSIMPTAVLTFLVASHWLKLQRSFLFILAVSAAISSWLFYLVQSPGVQHFYLLMPFMGICLAACVQLVCLRLNSRISAVLFGAVLAVGAVMVKFWPATTPMTSFFPGYQSWQPKQQVGADGLIELSQWLMRADVKQRTFCLIGSSSLVNESILFESWQIVPASPKYPFVGRMLNQSQVDSVNGPPAESIQRCDIALVAVPLQTHLERGQQDTVRIVQEEITGHTGIGEHYQEMRERFPLANGVEVIPYERVTDITPADYRALLGRYFEMKAKEKGAHAGRTS